MRSGGWSPRALLGLVLATAIFGVALAQSPPSEESYNGAGCYGCHRAWSPVAMKTMFVIRPTDVEPVPVGGLLELGAEVQEAWVAAPPWPKLTHFAASVNLAQAPSLGFASQDPPVLGVQFEGEIPVDIQRDRVIDQHSGSTLIQVPAGTSELVLTLSPDSTDPFLGPDLQMRLFPGRNTGGGSTWFDNRTVNERGRGEPEVWVVTGNANVSRLGTTAFALEALVNESAHVYNYGIYPEQRPIHFTVTMDAYRNTTGETQQFVVVDRTVDAGGSTILPFQLLATQLPGANETVMVTVNATAYYPHTSGGGRDDYGNFSKSTTVRVAVVDGRVTLQEAAPATIIAQGSGTVSLARISEAIGYMSAFLLISSILSGGMFGTASRRAFNRLFHTARRRVAFHNALSYFLMLAAVLHTILFIVEKNYEWTLGIIWGSLAILAMAGLGVTGAWQVSMIRRWSFPLWKWTHYGLALAAILFTIVHGLLDGANFGAVQDAVGWDNPFPDPRDIQEA